MKRVMKLFFWILVASLTMNCSRNVALPVYSTPQQPAQDSSAVQQQAIPQGKPSLQLTETMHDFGKVSEEKEYRYDFKVKNTGTATLEIKKVLPG